MSSDDALVVRLRLGNRDAGETAAALPVVMNLFGSHSPPLAANTGNERQNTPPLAAEIVYLSGLSTRRPDRIRQTSTGTGRVRDGGLHA
jgi:hypothetical protein